MPAIASQVVRRFALVKLFDRLSGFASRRRHGRIRKQGSCQRWVGFGIPVESHWLSGNHSGFRLYSAALATSSTQIPGYRLVENFQCWRLVTDLSCRYLLVIDEAPQPRLWVSNQPADSLEGRSFLSSPAPSHTPLPKLRAR
jgi:hypothetical protein